MSLLKDSVSKLRAAHLMDGRNPRALPVDTMSDTSGDEAYVRHSRKPIAGSCMVRTGMSNECGGYRPCNGCDSQHSDTSYARCSLRRHAAYDKGHGDGLVKAPQPQTSSAGRRRTYYRAHARSAVSEEPRQPRMSHLSHLQKSQSLVELQTMSTPPSRGMRRRFARTSSAHSATPTGPSDGSGSDAEQPTAADTASRCRRSVEAGLDSWPTSVSRSSSSVSVSSSRSKGKRTLPRVPSVGGSELEERKKRISNQVLKRAQRKVLSLAEKHLSVEGCDKTLPASNGNGNGNDHHVRANQCAGHERRHAHSNTAGDPSCGHERRHAHSNTAGDPRCGEVLCSDSNGSRHLTRNDEYVTDEPDGQRTDEYGTEGPDGHRTDEYGTDGPDGQRTDEYGTEGPDGHRTDEYGTDGPDGQRTDEFLVHTVDLSNVNCSDETDEDAIGGTRPPQQLRRVNGSLQLHVEQDDCAVDNVCATSTSESSHDQPSARHRVGDRTSASADALQRIIRDLRDASTQPIGKTRASCQRETSDGFSSPPSLSSSLSSSSSERHVNDVQLFPPITQDRSVAEDDGDIANGIGRYLEMSQSITSSLQQRKLHGMTGQYDGSDVAVRNGVSLSHPPLHRIVKCCDLMTVVLENTCGHDVGEYGIELFESAYCDTWPEGTAVEDDTTSFRSPEGRRPVIGRTRGAFLPVSSTTDGGSGGTILSLVAIDRMVQNSIARCSESLREGDYLIEVNGAYVVQTPVDETRRLLSFNQRTLHLVVARSRLAQGLVNPVAGKQQPPTRKDVSVDKELEKMKLKYTTLRQTTERNIDTIAELQLELKERQTLIRQLEDELRQQQDQAHAHAQQAAARDEKIVHWRREANQRSVEIARLKFDARQKEDRIAQLRKLLIQQTELMHLQGFNSGSVSDAEYEEHISEV